MKSKSLQDLGAIRQKINDVAQAAALAELARREAERRAEAERHLFARAVGAVQPLPVKERVHIPPYRPTPRPLQQDLDDQAALVESMSDEFDVSTLLDVDDQLSFRRPGIGTDVTRKLRKGEWSIQGQLDLHGLRSDEARTALGQFIRDAKRMGWRCVRVVHGKGLGSPGKEPVLKSKVQRWLVQKNEVLAFVQAKPSDGGAGALVVLLAPGNA
ncbi:DNA mismatch repair protein MutS [Limnohabitans sp. JirII-29]|uniref:Smr/MutS family protein n=1 Tax=unclassified Limnohabitans TaxID=2626134 RepID=UPI000C1ED517|nr:MULTISPECIES: Smr/MutS family protein [unclassified Limnohabitans]PIT79177.1 DNA mismatch repair protein MutS [Limnohabitans sp. JirII-31]PUE25314.1 DNA mismatch repair protein MutS [Limnohabitans sp. JirII-29]